MTIKNNQIENFPKVLPEGPAPVVGPNQGAFYPKDMGGVTEGFFVDDQNREIQLTENGSIKLPPSSGEANTASNLGAGNGVFASKLGVDLRFKSIVAGTNVSITNDSTTITINATGGSGETNTASNLGVSGEGVFASKVGVDLQFKKLIAGTNVSLSSDSNAITINATGGSGETNTASNLGAGQGVYSTKVGVDLRFKSLVAGTNVSLSSDSNQITINATGGSGETNTASNLGLTGEGVFASKVGVDLQFKKLIAGTNTTLSSDANSITINSTGGGSDSVILRRVTTTNANDVQILAYGSSTDINNITVIKSTNTVTLSTIASGVRLISVQAYFSGTDVGSNTNINIAYPEPNGATTLAESLLPTVTRYTTTFNPFGTQAGSITNTSGVITVQHSGGVVANNPATLKLVF